MFAGFKNLTEEDRDNCPIGEDLCERLNEFHERLMGHVSLKALLAPPEEEVSSIVILIITSLLGFFFKDTSEIYNNFSPRKKSLKNLFYNQKF